MGLEELTVSRRGFLSLTAGTLAGYALDLPVFAQDKKAKQGEEDIHVLKKSRISYDKIKEAITKDQKGDQAGKYEQLKQQYLEQVLVEEFKIVQHKQKNKEGFVASWFYWSDAQQKKKAEERIKADLTAQGGDSKSEDYVSMFDSTLPSTKMYFWHRSGVGNELKNASILVHKSIFDLAAEQDVFSTIDYVCAIASAREYNILVGDKKMDMRNPMLNFNFAQNNKITNFYARAKQWANIISGKRKVSSDFKTDLETKYKEARDTYESVMSSLEASEDDASKEAFTVMSTYLKQVDAELQRATELGKREPPRR